MRVGFERLLKAMNMTQEHEFDFTLTKNGEQIYESCVLSIKDIHEIGIEQIESRTEVFGQNGNLNKTLTADKEYHLGRVKYFIENPTEITNIRLRHGCWLENGDDGGFEMYSTVGIEDGNHRLLAAMYLGSIFNEIDVGWDTVIDPKTLAYLMGDVATAPEPHTLLICRKIKDSGCFEWIRKPSDCGIAKQARGEV